MSRKTSIRRSFLETSICQDSDATNKVYKFSSPKNLQGFYFYAEFMMGEFELVVAEEYKF